MSIEEHSTTLKPDHLSSPSVIHSQCSEREEDLSDCVDLVRQIHPEELPRIATEVRGSQCPEAVSVSNVPHAGSFNLVYEIKFADDLRWAARIPKHGTSEKFGDAQASTMQYELELLRFIRAKTQMPVPEVYHYDLTFDNPLGAPFSLCAWLEGVPASYIWHDDSGPTPLHDRRMRLLDSLAQAMSQLNLISSDSIGVPMIRKSDHGEFIVEESCEAIRARDPAKEIQWMIDHREELTDEDGDPAIFYKLGPFSSTADYLRALFANSSSGNKPYSKTAVGALATKGGSYRLMHIIIDAIDEVEKKSARPEFVLTHTDLDTQNVLINEDGSLTGIIDWDGIHTGPKQIGYAAYPVLLTRDMSPWDYGYWSGDDDMKAREDRPSELRELRKIYRSMFEKHAGAAAAKDTVNSHLYRAVERACSQSHLLSSIICKLVRVCLPDKLPIDVKFQENGATQHAGPSYDSEEDSNVSSNQDADNDEDKMDKDTSSSEADSQEGKNEDDKTTSVLPSIPEVDESFRRKSQSSSTSKRSMHRLASWIGLPFVIIKQFIAGLVTKGRRRSSAMQSLLEAQTPAIEVIAAEAPRSEIFPEAENSIDAMDIDTPAQDQPVATIENEDKSEAKDSDEHDHDSDAASNAGSDAGSSSEVPELPENPNEYYPPWIFDLYLALNQDTVSEEKIQVLRQFFVDKFSSDEIVEEILPD